MLLIRALCWCISRLLRGYNHGSDSGACGWLMDRTHIKLVCALELNNSLVKEFSHFGGTELAGDVNDNCVLPPLVREQFEYKTIVVRNEFLTNGPLCLTYSTSWMRVEHFTLGGLELRGRSRDSVILSPWTWTLSPKPGDGIPFHALWLHVPGQTTRRLFITDGCIRLNQDFNKVSYDDVSWKHSPALQTWHSGQLSLNILSSQWNMVGIVLEEACFLSRLNSDSCQLVRLPLNEQVVQIVPADWVSTLVVLTRMTYAPGMCCLIEPAGYMVQRTSGSFEFKYIKRGDTTELYKSLVFLNLGSVNETSLLPRIEEDIPIAAAAGKVIECRGDGSFDLIPGKFHDIAEYILKVKPVGDSSPTGPPKLWLTLKEITIGGTYVMFERAKGIRIAAGYSNDCLNYTDIGSGVGNTAMFMMILYSNIGRVHAIEKQIDHHNLARTWVHNVAKSMPMAVLNMDKMLDSLVCADCLEENPTKNILQESDVIFINNLLFDYETKINLNAMLAHKIDLWATKPGVVVVTTAPMGWPSKGNGQFINSGSIDFPVNAFSWKVDKTLEGFIAMRIDNPTLAQQNKNYRNRKIVVQHNVQR